MKLKALIAALFVAGFASSFALAGGTRSAADTTTGATGSTAGTTTGKQHGDDNKKHAPKCQNVALKGSKGSGSVSFTVDKASKKGDALEGKPATLTIPADASITANACMDAAGALTLRELKVTWHHPKASEQH